jgi:CBS domain-containing protein
VSGERPVREVAQMMVTRRVHRLLVTEGRRLLGLVTTLDLVRAIAEERLAT